MESEAKKNKTAWFKLEPSGLIENNSRSNDLELVLTMTSLPYPDLDRYV